MEDALTALRGEIDRHNAEETARRRRYFDYLTREQPSWYHAAETFEQHLHEYAFWARVAAPVTASDEKALAAASVGPLPAELAHLYRTLGGLVLGNGVGKPVWLPPPAELLRRLRLREGWTRLPSLGLVDMMHASWGRPEALWNFRPESGLVTQQQVDALNSMLTCVGWFARDTENAHRYVVFDRHGTVSVMLHHQDEWYDLWARLQATLDGEPLDPVPLFETLRQEVELARRLMAEEDAEEEERMRGEKLEDQVTRSSNL